LPFLRNYTGSTQGDPDPAGSCWLALSIKWEIQSSPVVRIIASQ
jgi:hypothetical protein